MLFEIFMILDESKKNNDKTICFHTITTFQSKITPNFTGDNIIAIHFSVLKLQSFLMSTISMQIATLINYI